MTTAFDYACLIVRKCHIFNSINDYAKQKLQLLVIMKSTTFELSGNQKALSSEMTHLLHKPPPAGITKCQGTAKLTSLYRGVVINGTPI